MRGRIQIGRTACQRGQMCRNCIHDLARRDACRHALCIRRKLRDIRIPACRQRFNSAAHQLSQFLRERWKFFFISRECIAPLRFALLAAINRFEEMGTRCFGNIKCRLLRPAEIAFGQPHFFCPERRTVCFKSILLVWRAVAEMRAHQNQ